MKNLITRWLFVVSFGALCLTGSIYPMQAQLESLKSSLEQLKDGTEQLKESLGKLQATLSGEEAEGPVSEKKLAEQKRQLAEQKKMFALLRQSPRAEGMRSMMQQEWSLGPLNFKEGLLERKDAFPLYVPLSELMTDQLENRIVLGQILYVGAGVSYMLEPLINLYLNTESGFNQEAASSKGSKTLTDKAFDKQEQCSDEFVGLLDVCKKVKVGNKLDEKEKNEYSLLTPNHPLIKNYDLFLDEVEYCCNDFMTNVDKRYKHMSSTAWGNERHYDATGPLCADKDYQSDYSVHFEDIKMIPYSPENLKTVMAVVAQYGSKLLDWHAKTDYYLQSYNEKYTLLKDATGFNYLMLPCTWCKEHFDRSQAIPLELQQVMGKLYDVAKALLSNSVKQMNINEHKQWAALRQLVEFFRGCIAYGIKTDKQILQDLLPNMMWRTQGLVLAYILLSEGYADDDFLWWASGAILFYRGQGSYSVGGHRQKRGADFACYQLLQIIKNGGGRTFGTVQKMCDDYINYDGSEIISRLGLTTSSGGGDDSGPIGGRRFSSLNQTFNICFMGAITCYGGGNGYTLFGAQAKADILGMIRAQRLLSLVAQGRYAVAKKQQEDDAILEFVAKVKADQKKLKQALVAVEKDAKQAQALLKRSGDKLEPAALEKLKAGQLVFEKQRAELVQLQKDADQVLLDLKINPSLQPSNLETAKKLGLAPQALLQQRAELQQVTAEAQALVAVKIQQDLEIERRQREQEQAALQKKLQDEEDEQIRLALVEQIRVQQEALDMAVLEAQAKEVERLQQEEQRKNDQKAAAAKELHEQAAKKALEAIEKEKKDCAARKNVAGETAVREIPDWLVDEFTLIANINSGDDIIHEVRNIGRKLPSLLDYFTYLSTNISTQKSYKELLSLSSTIVRNMLASKKTLERLRTNMITTAETKQFAIFCVFLATCPDSNFANLADRFTWADMDNMLSIPRAKLKNIDMFRLYIILVGGARGDKLKESLDALTLVSNDTTIFFGLEKRDVCINALGLWIGQLGYYNQEDLDNIKQFCVSVTNPEKSLQETLRSIKDKLGGTGI